MSFLPSLLTFSLEGNQPVGICPTTLRLATSIMATALMPDSATKRRFWSGESVIPKGIIPRKFPRRLSIESGMFFKTFPPFISITEMQSLFPLLTKI